MTRDELEEKGVTSGWLADRINTAIQQVAIADGAEPVQLLGLDAGPILDEIAEKIGGDS